MAADGGAPGRLVPALVALICLLPVVAAWLLVSGPPDWRPSQRTAHGELLEPPPWLPLGVARSAAGATLGFPGPAERWVLAYASRGSCERRCEQVLEALRRAQLAVGKHVVRVERLLLLPPGTPAPPVLSAPPAGFVAALGDPARWALEPLLYDAGAVLVIDARGRAVLRYPPAFDIEGLVADLRRLLGAAHG